MAIWDLAATVGAGIFGAAKSAKAGRKARAITQQQREKNEDWYNRRMAADYTARSDYQKILNDQRDLMLQSRKRDKATNVVAGGTDASLALAKEADNAAMADIASNQAANASNYKDAVENQYMSQDNQYAQQLANSYQQQAQNIANATAQAVGSGLNLTGILTGQAKGKKNGEEEAVKAYAASARA